MAMTRGVISEVLGETVLQAKSKSNSLSLSRLLFFETADRIPKPLFASSRSSLGSFLAFSAATLYCFLTSSTSVSALGSFDFAPDFFPDFFLGGGLSSLLEEDGDSGAFSEELDEDASLSGVASPFSEELLESSRDVEETTGSGSGSGSFFFLDSVW